MNAYGKDSRLVFSYHPGRSWLVVCPCCDTVGRYEYGVACEVARQHTAYHNAGWVGQVKIG